MVWASSRLKNTTASAVSAPFLVAPKESTSTPAFQVASAGVPPRRATALARRAPSMCTHRRRARATSTMARTSARVYTVLASVPWVMLTARGVTSVAGRAMASSTIRASSAAMILPSTLGTGTVRAFPPDQNSGPPHSLPWRCPASDR
jgi:hypothetical protein